MESANFRFRQELGRIETHLKGRELRQKLLSWDPPDQAALAAIPEVRTYREFLVANRQNDAIMEYSSCIVLMYGALEKFIEETVERCVDRLCDVAPLYLDLPKQILDSHTDLSANLLKARSFRKYESRVEELVVIKNLMTCVSGNEEFRVNSIAFSQHSVNFRFEKIALMFAQIGQGDLLKSMTAHDGFAQIAETRAGCTDITGEPLSVIFQDIDQLVDRRNDIAHGEPTNILAGTEILEVCEYLKAFGDALLASLLTRIIRFEIEHRSQSMPSPIAVHGRGIVCFATTPKRISVGSRIAAISGDNKVYHSQVAEIQIDNKPLNSVDENNESPFGMKVEFSAKDNWRYFLLDSVNN